MAVSPIPALPLPHDTPATGRGSQPASRLDSALERMGRLVGGAARFARSGRSGRVGPIGLDIGLESLNLVQLRFGADGSIGLRASACVQHTPDRDSLLAAPVAFKARLAEALRSQPFAGRRVVTALPAQAVRILPVPYNISGGRSDAAAIAQVLRERLDSDLSRYVIDYMPVRGDVNASERLALVAVAQRDAVIAHLELLRKAGLEVLALEIGPSAIMRLITTLSQPDSRQNQLVINFGETTSYLTVVSGRRLLQDQEAAFGEQAVLGQIATALQVSHEEARVLVGRYGLGALPTRSVAGDDSDVAQTLVEIIKPRLLHLVDEINRVLIYTASETHGASVGHIHLLGSLARWPGIEGLLQSMVEIPVGALDDPLGLFASPNGDTDRRGLALAIATGLALRGMRKDE
jgi:type IV pilus assembly protein PilM